MLILLEILFVIFFIFITKILQSYQQLWITLWITFLERMKLMAIDKDEFLNQMKELLNLQKSINKP